MDAPCDATRRLSLVLVLPLLIVITNLQKVCLKTTKGLFAKSVSRRVARKDFYLLLQRFAASHEKKQRERKKSTEIFSPNESDNGAKS